MKPIVLFFAVFLLSDASIAQTTAEVVIPPFKDPYCEYIRKLEAGKTDIDFRAFRESFLDSKQFIVAFENSHTFDSLESAMRAEMKKSNYQEIIKITKEMLSIDYTSMIAQKILRQTYNIIGDSLNAKKYHDISFGLLHSIVDNGNGKTCASGWPVIQVSEEYYILEMIDATLSTQSIEGHCDKMDVKIDGDKKTYYFDITKVIEGYNKLGLK